MRKYFALPLMLCVALPTLCRPAEGDWGFAQVFYLRKSVTENWSAITGSQLTWRDDFSEFYFFYADAGAGYRFHPNWSVDTVYRQAWWNIRDDWEIEHRPFINLNWFGSWRDIRVQNQARIEFRLYDWNRKDDLRFRNRTRVDFPWQVLPGGIKPYVEEEFFIGKNSEQVEMNWLSGGLYYKPNRNTKLKLGYRWVSIRTGNGWENRNQLVSGLSGFF